jgi:hypothetical protein
MFLKVNFIDDIFYVMTSTNVANLEIHYCSGFNVKLTVLAILINYNYNKLLSNEANSNQSTN